VRVVRGVRDLGKTVAVEGQVVKVHNGRFAIDDGQRDSLVALYCPPLGPHVERGQQVRAVISPHLHHLSALTVVAAAPPDPLGDSAPAERAQAWAPTLSPEALREATGLELRPVGAREMTGDFGPGIALQRFEDGQGNHLSVAFLPDLSVAGPLASLVTRMATQGGQAVTGIGNSATWSHDRMLAVTAGPGMFGIDVDFPGVPPDQRLATARNVAALVLEASGRQESP